MRIVTLILLYSAQIVFEQAMAGRLPIAPPPLDGRLPADPPLTPDKTDSETPDRPSDITVPGIPLFLRNNPAVTSSTVIGLTWSPPALNGGAEITGYEVWWN